MSIEKSPQKQFSVCPIREKLLHFLFEKATLVQDFMGVEIVLSIQTALNFGKPGRWY